MQVQSYLDGIAAVLLLPIYLFFVLERLTSRLTHSFSHSSNRYRQNSTSTHLPLIVPRAQPTTSWLCDYKGSIIEK